MLAICSAASSAISRFSRAVMLKPRNSMRVALSPMPSSARPCDTRSSMPTASAVRAGWLYSGITWRMPKPTRMRSVLAASADRNTSDAEQCEYSSRKWCSTAQAWWMPNRSASSTCSMASCTRRISAPSSHGLGSCNS